MQQPGRRSAPTLTTGAPSTSQNTCQDQLMAGFGLTLAAPLVRRQVCLRSELKWTLCVSLCVSTAYWRHWFVRAKWRRYGVGRLGNARK